MTDEYVNAKAREALKATHGDKQDAQKLMITWAVRDQQLLLGLAKPHIKALAAARIDRLTKRRSAGASNGNAVIAKSAVRAGKVEKRKSTAVPPPKSSERQATIMHRLAEAFKKK